MPSSTHRALLAARIWFSYSGISCWVLARTFSPCFSAPVAPSYLAVIDTTTDTIVDVDPDRPGIQAIELTGLRPSHRMHVDHEARRLYVSEPSLTFHPVEGGIDVIDLDSLRALGFVTTASSLLRTTCATAGRTTTSIPSNINKAHRDIVRRENVEQREIWSWDRVIRT